MPTLARASTVSGITPRSANVVWTSGVWDSATCRSSVAMSLSAMALRAPAARPEIGTPTPAAKLVATVVGTHVLCVLGLTLLGDALLWRKALPPVQGRHPSSGRTPGSQPGRTARIPSSRRTLGSQRAPVTGRRDLSQPGRPVFRHPGERRDDGQAQTLPNLVVLGTALRRRRSPPAARAPGRSRGTRCGWPAPVPCGRAHR